MEDKKDTVSAESPRPRNRMGKEIGDSGTMIFGGHITGEEYNSAVQGRTGLRTFDMMRRSDPTVRAALRAVILPLTQADWTLQAASEEEQDEKVCGLLKQELFERNIQFTDFLREALNMLPFGFSVFEKVLEATTYEGAPYIGIGKLASRKQTTIQKWETLEGKPGVTQQLVTGGDVSIPMQKLIVFTNEKEGDNYEGISVLRYAYKPWDIKNKLEKVNAIAIERHGLGVVDIGYPTSADQTEKDNAVEAAKNLRANESAYMSHPNEGWEVSFMDMKSSSTKDAMPTIKHYERQILKSVLAQFIELGESSSGGSRALSEDQSRLFELGLQAIARQVADTINEQLIQPLVDMNFAELPNGYPTLKFSKIGDEAMTETSEAVAKLVAADTLTPDPEMEQWLRDMIKAPRLPEDYAENYESRPRRSNPQPQLPVEGSTALNQARILKDQLIEAAEKRYDEAA